MVRSAGFGQSRLTLLVLVLASVSVIALDVGGAGIIDGIRDAAVTAAGPVRSAGATVFGPVGDALSGREGPDVEALEAEVEALRGQEAALANAESELAALYNQLGLAQPRIDDIPTAVARVIDNRISNFEDTFEIDIGATDGVKVGMPLVTEAGLVGRVTETAFGRANFRLLTDPEFRVGVLHTASSSVGTAQGTGGGAPLFVDIDIDVEVNAGDQFVTTGFDRSFFPGGVAVGRAIETRDASTPLEQQVVLEPTAQLDRLSFVTVLLFEPVS